MQSDKVKAFKNELRNYKYNKLQIEVLKKDIEYCFYQLGGVGGCDPSKEPIHSPPNKDFEYRIRDDISLYEAKLALYKAKVDEVDRILDKIPNKEKNIIIDVFLKGMSHDKAARKYYFAKSSITYRIDCILEKVLD